MHTRHLLMSFQLHILLIGGFIRNWIIFPSGVVLIILSKVRLTGHEIRLISLFSLWLSGLTISAQKAVVEDSYTDIICDKTTHAVMHFKRTITILQKNGANYGSFSCSCSPSNQLIGFKGLVTDASGRVVRKIRQKELQRLEYSPYLAISDYMMFFEYTPSFYPVTITYEWDMESKDDIIEFPPFCPQTNYDVSVKKAAYRLTAPSEMGVRYAIKSINSPVTVNNSTKGMQVMTLELTDLPALKEEPYARPIQERLPIAYFAPSFFVYYDTQGSLRDWTDFGKWQFGMLRGKDILPDDLCREIHQLTDHLKDDYEKIQVIYNLLRERTRYVATLLGVGGQRPSSAASVYNSGYGDCKGLTNLMRSMLKEISIESHYTTISTDNHRLIKDFASVGQMNHVILQIPLQKDTLWVECTNPQLPLGYIHQDIAGHDAIEVSKEGGKLVSLPVYADSTNIRNSLVHLTIDSCGMADMKISMKFCNQRYEKNIPLLKMDGKELQIALLRMIYAPQAEIANISIDEDGAKIKLDAKLTSQKFATSAGKRLFLPICPIMQSNYVPSSGNNRIEDLYIESGYCDKDDIILSIPEGFTIEALPENILIIEPYGTFSIILKHEGDRIIISHRLMLNSGIYDKALYTRFIDFMRTVSNAKGQNIVLRKKDKTIHR